MNQNALFTEADSIHRVGVELSFIADKTQDRSIALLVGLNATKYLHAISLDVVSDIALAGESSIQRVQARRTSQAGLVIAGLAVLEYIRAGEAT